MPAPFKPTPMICPKHSYVYFDDECPRCKLVGVVAIECEIDKIDRVVSTMHEQGFTSRYAVLVFNKPPATKGGTDAADVG